MNKEKQIEEMARLMCANYDGESGFCGDGGICDHDCWAYREATHLYDMGYRKTTDVLDEIEKTIRGALVLIGYSYKCGGKEIQIKEECYTDFLGYIAELKKKYTEGEKGDEGE